MRFMVPTTALAGVLLAATLAPAAAMAQAATPAAPAAQLFVLTYRQGPAWKPDRPISEQGLAPHGAYQKQLIAEGRSFAAGPFLTSLGGMAIIRAADLKEAQAVLAADPAIRNGVFVGAIEAWRPILSSNQPLPAN